MMRQRKVLAEAIRASLRGINIRIMQTRSICPCQAKILLTGGIHSWSSEKKKKRFLPPRPAAW